MGDGDALDLIVIGAGPAGLACAWEAASAGLQVAVLERGDVAGAKNLSGGRLYLEPLRGLCGPLLEGAPLERSVVSESIALAGDTDGASFLFVNKDARSVANSNAAIDLSDSATVQAIARGIRDEWRDAPEVRREALGYFSGALAYLKGTAAERGR